VINVSGVPGIVTKATATINGLTHSFSRDVNVLLVNPAGGNVKLMSHAGGSHPVSNVTLTFDDAASLPLPSTGQITNGTYLPSTFQGTLTFNTPAPAPVNGSAMNALNSVSPNGQWSLYVQDDTTGDSGYIANGWSLNLTTLSPLNPVSDQLTFKHTATGLSVLTLSGLSSHSYQLQSSTNLTSWTTFFTGTTAPNGTLQTTVTNTLKRSFYRSLRL
jgi:subtilisin-like proprotein convertase family protein